MSLLPHQQRVVDEKKELDDKILKLDTFIKNEQGPFISLSTEEQDRLRRQFTAMKSYTDILDERIQAF